MQTGVVSHISWCELDADRRCFTRFVVWTWCRQALFHTFRVVNLMQTGVVSHISWCELDADRRCFTHFVVWTWWGLALFYTFRGVNLMQTGVVLHISWCELDADWPVRRHDGVEDWLHIFVVVGQLKPLHQLHTARRISWWGLLECPYEPIFIMKCEKHRVSPPTHQSCNSRVHIHNHLIAEGEQFSFFFFLFSTVWLTGWLILP